MIWTLVGMAFGYGEVVDGLPSASERLLHLWTNAARVDPEAFEADYNTGGCSVDDFTDSERSAQQLLFYDHNLNDAGRYHSTDMFENNWFDHNSSDGTSFADRLARFYSESGYVGENIAYGYPDEYIVTMQGWMCSSGHRANIMLGDYNELGTGIVSNYYTQDFALGTVEWTGPVAMGAHDPSAATEEASFWADWQDSAAPARLEVVVDGEAMALTIHWGEPTRGVYGATLSPAEPGDCHEYYFNWATEAGLSGTFPETGSYLYGADCGDELWIDEQLGLGGDEGGGELGGGEEGEGDPNFAVDTSKLEIVGCQSAAAGPWALLGALSLWLRRRR